MPAPETNARHQDAVLWPLAGHDHNGRSVVSANKKGLIVRWVDRQNEFRDAQGNTVATDATVVVNEDVDIGSILWKGKLRDVSANPTGLFIVVTRNITPDIKGRAIRRTLGLMRHTNKLPLES